MAQFVIDQVGLPAGVLDVSRTDGLDTGATVTIDAVLGGGSTFKFELLWVPPGDITAEATLAVTGNPAIFTFTPTAAVYGTYRIKLTVDEGESATESIVIRVLTIRTPVASLPIPAFNTVADEQASLLLKGPLQVLASEDNATDYSGVLSPFNYTGWWRALHELILQVDFLAGGGGSGEINTGANVGSGTGLVFRDKIGVALNFKRLLQGTRMTITDNADDITIATTAEINVAANVGGAAGTVFRDKVSQTLNFRTLTGTGGIAVSVNVDVIEIDGSAIVGGGEANLGDNVGTGEDVFRDKTGVTLNFRGINAINGLQAIVNIDNINIGAITGTRDYSNQDLIDAKTVTLEQLLDNGNSGATATVDFADAQQQTITLNAATPALTIDPPPGQANGLVLFVVQDATGSRQPTFSSNVRWSNNGIVPTFTADPNAIDILHFVYDGTDMFGFFNENFA